MEATAARTDVDEPTVRQWERFFKDRLKPEINDAAIGYPQRKSVTVDFRDLDRYAHELAEELLLNPVQTLRIAEQALKTVDVPVEPRPHLRVRVDNLHVEGGRDHATVGVRDLRAEHLGRLLAVKGLVKRVTEVRPHISAASFQCRRCMSIIHEPQDEHLVLKEPLECYEDQGGCGAHGAFKLLTDPNVNEGTRFVDTQKVEIEETPESLRGGEQPQRLTAWLDEDLCARVAPGDRVVMTGILQANVRKVGGQKSTRLDIFLNAAGISSERKEFEDIEITPEEEAEIIRLSRDPHLYDKLRGSLAPSIHGLEAEKEALLLQLFGGLPKKVRNGGRLRGDIHILFVGDPGVAKSQLIRTVSKLAPRGIYTSGQSTSAAGLTAAAVQDEGFGEGRWTLEAGAMVLADKGLCAIDEIDKMDKRDRSAMHESLEQQTVSVAKAGITATLQSRCAVVGAANPKNGRFDEFSPFADQIELPPALISRFDLIFILTDKPDPGRDSDLASHILDVHRGNAMRELLEAKPEVDLDRDEIDRTLHVAAPVVDSEFMRKYVAYAKRHVFPVLSPEAKQRIQSYYVDLRRAASGPEGGPIPLTARQLEAFVRLAEASAKVRLSDVVTVDDADRAIELVESYIRRLNQGEGGIMDIDSVASGTSHSLQAKQRIILDAIRELVVLNDGAPAEEEDLMRKVAEEGVDEDDARRILERLNNAGQILKPGAGKYRLVNNR